MKILWVAFLVLATLGSVYPFNFQAPGFDADAVRVFLQSCCAMPSRGDIVGNVILFVPIGFTGMFAVWLGSPARRRFFFVCVISAIFALALQLIQIYLPSRDENLQDVVWNTIGTAVGAALAIVAGRYSASSERGSAFISLVPLTLVGTWLTYRLIPFVPSLDFQLIKDSLKPLLGVPLDLTNAAHDLAAWLVVAYLLKITRRGARLDNYLPALMFAVFCLEVLIVDNSITASNVVGAFLAVFVWFGVLRNNNRQEGAIVVLLLCALVLTGLAPFVTRQVPLQFNWLPFRGFLGGSMYVNAQSAAEKVFLYGSLVYLMWRTGINRAASVLIGFSVITFIELAQTRFIRHTPEITDSLLVIFAAFALLALERHESRSAFFERPMLSPKGHVSCETK